MGSNLTSTTLACLVALVFALALAVNLEACSHAPYPHASTTSVMRRAGIMSATVR